MKSFYKAIFIDFDDTIVKYLNHSGVSNPTWDWLKARGVAEPQKVMSPEIWNNLDFRLKYLGISHQEYLHIWSPEIKRNELKFKAELLRGGYIVINAGVREFLSNLKVPVALISNGHPGAVNSILEFYKLKKYFSYIHRRTYGQDDLKKPDKRLAEIVMEALNLKKNEKIIMIGDSEEDLIFAKNANLRFYNVFNKQVDFRHYFVGFEDLIDYLRKFHKEIID